MEKPKKEHWCQNHLASRSLLQLLEKIDKESAEQTRLGGCWFCSDVLHRADYDRKPPGLPQWNRRFSFCCSREGCRRRCTPPSVRFLGRRVYASLVVVLLSAMTHGLSAKRVERLRQTLEIDRRTLERWRQWWLETFVHTRLWRAKRALFMPPVCEATMPWSLAEYFEVTRQERLIDLLIFLKPLTAPKAPEFQAM